MHPHNPPRPTSSPPRPHRRDDLPQVTSSLVPLPSGGRGHRSRPRRPADHLVHLVPGTTSGTRSR
ncbi:hypothetical protein [Microcystis phage MinS1]|nr:hypothetical protein [Microcystis phage MinS1]